MLKAVTILMLKNFLMREFKAEYQKLNPNQKKAVDTLDGPVMVVAGPGTGKTQVLALRIVNILEKKKAEPNQILALTFSDRAAIEMTRRIAEYLGSSTYDITIQTFHGFCNDIIKDNPDRFLFAKELIQLDELMKLKLFRKIIKKTHLSSLKPYNDPFHHLSEMKSKIGELKKEGVSPDQLLDFLKGEEEEHEKDKVINPRTGRPKVVWQAKAKQIERLYDLQKVYSAYTKALNKEGYYDFDDMIIKVIECWRKDPEFLDEYQKKFSFILCDEYQDTNTSQNELVTMLTEGISNPNVFVVGDDDQSIYRFQGANLENILAFEKRYPKAQIIPIVVNYRSFQSIIDASYSIVEKNKERLTDKGDHKIKKIIKAAQGSAPGGAEVELYEFSSGGVENFFLAQKIQELKNDGSEYAQIAILCRTNQEAADIAEYLLAADIPVELGSGVSILHSDEMARLLMILRAVNNTLEDHDVYRVMSLDLWGIDPYDFIKFSVNAAKSKVHYLEQWEKERKAMVGKGSSDVFRDFRKIDAFFEKITEWKKIGSGSPALLVLEKILYESGMIDEYVAADNIKALNKLSTFFDFVRNAQKKNPAFSISELLDDIGVMQEERISIEEKPLSMAADDVRILTAHSAKGMEFEVVFIPHLCRGIWDGKKSRESIKLPQALVLKETRADNSRAEDERRLFFVALTRAKHKAFLTKASAYEAFGDLKAKMSSKYLEELDKSLVAVGDPTPYEGEAISRMKLELAPRAEERRAGTALKEKIEEEFLLEQVRDLQLSSTSLNLYLSCPLRYKFEKLLRIPMAKSRSAVLGTAVHKGLELFYGAVMRGQKAAKELMLKGFEESLDDAVLLPDDMAHAKHEGRRLLEGYYERYHRELVCPLALETSFSRVYLDDVLLTGKVDKIESMGGEKEGGKKPAVKVIDYKTGQQKTKGELLGKTKKSDLSYYRQLVFYKLLSTLDKGFPYEVMEVEIDFIKPKNGKYSKEPFAISLDETEELKALIRETVQKIKHLEFPKKKGYNQCRSCPLKDLCK